MIFTIGYQKLTPERLKEIATKLRALVVDCRHKPVSRKKGFGGNQLRELLGTAHYKQMGHWLGGRGNVREEGILWLRGIKALLLTPENARITQHPNCRNVMLLCQEEAPGECHRHEDICKEHFPDAVHIYQDQLVRVSDLNHAEDNDLEEYEIEGELDDLLDGSLKLEG